MKKLFFISNEIFIYLCNIKFLSLLRHYKYRNFLIKERNYCKVISNFYNHIIFLKIIKKYYEETVVLNFLY